MVDYSNEIFKYRKNSGFVVKFRLSSDKAIEKQREYEHLIACETPNLRKTCYIRKTFKSIAGIKNATQHFTAPWCYEDLIAFIYKVDDEFPCAAYVKGNFVEFNNLSDEERDIYRSYSGSYTDDICHLWVDVKEWP